MGAKKKLGNRLVQSKNGPKLKLGDRHNIFVAQLDSEGKEKPGSKFVPQRALTAECWSVQFWGLDHCKSCPALDTEECGGQNIRKTGRNEKGVKVGKAGLEAR